MRAPVRLLAHYTQYLDFPKENLDALQEAVEEYGVYPITPF
jgi:hypothetical protein